MPSFNAKLLRSIAGLALFTFTFLGSEFFFDRQMGLLTSAEQVVSAQAAILGASVVGFLAYAGISKVLRNKFNKSLFQQLKQRESYFVFLLSQHQTTLPPCKRSDALAFSCLAA